MVPRRDFHNCIMGTMIMPREHVARPGWPPSAARAGPNGEDLPSDGASVFPDRFRNSRAHTAARIARVRCPLMRTTTNSRTPTLSARGIAVPRKGVDCGTAGVWSGCLGGRLVAEGKSAFTSVAVWEPFHACVGARCDHGAAVSSCLQLSGYQECTTCLRCSGE